MIQAMCRIAPRPRRETKATARSGAEKLLAQGDWPRRGEVDGMEERPHSSVERDMILRGTRIATTMAQGQWGPHIDRESGNPCILKPALYDQPGEQDDPCRTAAEYRRQQPPAGGQTLPSVSMDDRRPSCRPARRNPVCRSVAYHPEPLCNCSGYSRVRSRRATAAQKIAKISLVYAMGRHAGAASAPGSALRPRTERNLMAAAVCFAQVRTHRFGGA